MGEQKVTSLRDKEQMQIFVRALLKDLQAMEYMLENDWFESDITRIGAEQEMVLIDKKTLKVAPKAMEALDKMQHLPWVETELAKFNLETNLQPRVFSGSCFSDLEKENQEKLDIIQEHLDEMDIAYLLTGILPTLRKNDLDLHNLTPLKRYKALMDTLRERREGGSFELRLMGVDELLVKHDSPLLEACNTSFQVHLQIDPASSVKLYNIAQTLAAPVMAIAANSPIVFGKRLWHESRIALFQQSIDTRSSYDHMRERSPRVNFGNDWLHESILDIYREDIARFRVLISADQKEDALSMIRENKVPKLRALQVHNSTVYRWNRPCYGISDSGKPHLRIENRVLPAGPTVTDEVANACFWLGCMKGMEDYTDDVRTLLSFADVRDNFGKAAKVGIDSSFSWFDDKKISVCELIRTQLLEIAEHGLKKHNVDTADIDKYLGIIKERAKRHMNGARWGLRSFTKLKETCTPDEALTVMTASMLKNQHLKNNPAHQWKLPEPMDLKQYLPTQLQISEFMTTDLYTVQKDDIIEFVSEMMDFKQIRFTPVEDEDGNLVGLVSGSGILRHLVRDKNLSQDITKVEDIMIPDPVTVSADTQIVDAMKMMSEKNLGCLLVTKDKELLGIVTATDFVQIASRLMERMSIT